ncbi:MAG: DUF4388 domain-containing protein [Planctomycetota bacterium]|jgi:outer membrane protein assembly factor BamB/tetratricopeptide (TPR) repeat protein
MALRGNLESFSLPEIFQSLSVNQHTGTLRVNDGESEKLIYFSGGEINLMASGKRETTKIGDFLIKTGRATPQQVQECLKDQERSGKMLGQLLVERGVIGEEDVREAVINKIEEEIYDLFLWKKADFEFLPGYCPHEMVDPLQKTSKLRINANSVIMESLRRMDEWERIAQVIPDLTLVFSPANLNPDVITRIGISENHKREIWLVDGKKSVNELVAISMLNKFEFCKLMYESFRNHVVAPARKEDMVSMGEEAVRRRDLEGVKKFFWNALHATPKDHLLRQRWAGHLKALKLNRGAFEQYRILGDQYLAEGNNASAIGFYQEALKLISDDIITMRHLADALDRDARTNEAVDLWVRIAELEVKNENHGEAIKIYLVLIEHRPDELDFHTQLGESYLALEQEESALRYYELALNKAAEAGKQGVAQNLFLAALEKFKNIDNIQRRLLDQVKGRVKVYLPNRVQRLIIFSSLTIVILVALVLGLDVTLATMRFNAARKALPDLEYDKAVAAMESAKAWILPIYSEEIDRIIKDLKEQEERNRIAEEKERAQRKAIKKVLKKAEDFIREIQFNEARIVLLKLYNDEKYNEHALVKEMKLPFRVETSPPGAEVFVDNESQGKSPLTIHISPSRSSANIEIRKTGFWPIPISIDPKTYRFDLTGGYEVKLERKELWIYPPGDESFKSIVGAPVLDGNRLYVTGFKADGGNAVVVALDANNGKFIWETPLPDTKGRLPGRIVRVSRKLILTDGGGRIFKLAWDSGKVEKTSELEQNPIITAGPLQLSQRKNSILIGTNTGFIYEIRIIGWATKKILDLGCPVVDLQQLGERVAVSGEKDGIFRFINVDTREWAGDPLKTEGSVSGKAAVIANVAYVPAAKGRLHAINLETAKELWRYGNPKDGQYPVASDVIAVDNNLFFLDNAGNLHSLSYTKDHRWMRSVSGESTSTIHGVWISSVDAGTPEEKLILVTGSNPPLQVFRPGDGNPLWGFRPPHRMNRIIGPAQYRVGYIFFSTAGGRVYAIIK